MIKKIPSKKAGKYEYLDYIKKAEEFHKSMMRNFTDGLWNAAASSAIHCAILANDALLVCYHGLKSSGPRHDDAPVLLETYFTISDIKEKAAQLRKVIAKKTIVEYESRLFQQKEAEVLVTQADRFYKWVKNKLPK